MSVCIFAPAKINLTLEVGRPRADGMHPLQSVAMFADVGDWVAAAEADALSLRIEGEFACDLSADADNLVLRAARALAIAAGVEAPRAALTLIKNLPVASGIGGGSADAAAALRALNRLWRLDLDDAALADIARALGADVPVCVFGRAAYLTGTGVEAAPLALPMLHAVLVNPLQKLATAAVYRQFDELGLGEDFEARAAPSWRSVSEVIAGAASFGNDLEPAAHTLMPALTEISDAVASDRRVRHAALSGSGATMFGLTASAEDAAGFAADLAAAHPHWWVRPARLA